MIAPRYSINTLSPGRRPSSSFEWMRQIDEHERLIDSGLALHESRKYSDALPYFQQAFEQTPNCVAARYNLANTLHMLGRDAEAREILKTLLETPDQTFVNGCPLNEDPRPFKLDALYLMFVTTLYDTEDWRLAYPYAIRHLHERSGDVESVFTGEYIESEIRSLKSEYDT